VTEIRTATIAVDQFIAAPPEKVWRGLTDPELLARWWVPGDIAAVVGHRFHLQMPGYARSSARCWRSNLMSASSTPSPTGPSPGAWSPKATAPASCSNTPDSTSTTSANVTPSTAWDQAGATPSCPDSPALPPN
jgi:hypothetical protein